MLDFGRFVWVVADLRIQMFLVPVKRYHLKICKYAKKVYPEGDWEFASYNFSTMLIFPLLCVIIIVQLHIT